MLEMINKAELKTEILTDRFIRNQDVAESSRKTYGRTIKQFIAWIETNGTPGAITRSDILDYKRFLTDNGKSANTVTGYINTVKKFFEWLEVEGIYKNVAHDIKGAKRHNTIQKDALTIPQVKRLLGSLKDHPGKNHREEMTNKRDYAMINLMIRTGLRTIELERANVEDIRQSGGAAVLYVQAKGYDSKDDRVVLNPPALDPIMDYLNARGNVKGTDPLFISHANNSNGERITTRSIRRATKKHMGTANISSPKLTTHSLRHTAVTFVLLAGGTVQDAQILGRHKSVDTTMIYVHNINRIKDAPENKIDQLLEGGAK